MTEVKDLAIKLFGQTIPLLPRKGNCQRIVDEEEDRKKPWESELPETRREDDSKAPVTSGDNYPRTPSVEKERNPSETEDQSETSISQEKTLKKPDKIRPCPRCNSMETKFCYYNNYNVNQPRHFCKKCQRYWTAGGTMRNVPVGSGRRKIKSSCSSYYRHILVSECLQAARMNGSVLSFGADSQPPRESIALNPFENSQHLVKISISGGGRRENGDYDTRRASSASTENRGNGNPVFHQSVVKNLPLPPCFFPWNSPPWRSGIPSPALGPCGLPFPFYPPSPYWGSTTPPGSRNVPWIPPSASSTLGKHLRDVSEKEEPLNENDSERAVWIPKTFRVDNPNEAAKISLWSTQGIKNEKNYSTCAGGGLFKGFRSMGEEKTHADGTYLALQANPAALSRSFNFRESVNQC